MAAIKPHPSDNLHAGMREEVAQALVSQHFEWLTRSENIHALAVDWKTVQGKVTDRPALVFYVSEKKPVERLTPEEEIPRQVKDDARKCMIDTDVVEMKNFTDQVAPAAGGAEITVQVQGDTTYAGTLGVNIAYIWPSQVCLLTSAHLVNYDPSTVGTTIYQRTDSGESTALFPITGMFPVKKYDLPNPPNPTRNKADILWANVTDMSKISKCIIPPTTVPSGIRDAVKGDVFTLSSANTGFYDDVQVTNTSFAVRMKGENPDGSVFYTFWEKLIMYSLPTQGGDSGAALLSKNDHCVIGLHKAGNGVDTAVASQIYPALATT